MRQTASVVFALVMTAIMAIGCGGSESEEATSWPDSLPDEIIGEFATEETDSGKVQWKLIAPAARRFSKQNMFLLDEPTIEFYDREGSLQTTLISDHGEYIQGDQGMLAYGNVVVTTVDGDVLETDSLRYDSETDKITSESFVKLTRGENVVTGNGLECDHNLNSVDIKRNFQATIKEDDGSLSEESGN